MKLALIEYSINASEKIMGNRQLEDKRTKILEATLRLISEKGFHGTPISKVAKEAGVSTGIIYHYFKDKHELLNFWILSLSPSIIL